MAHTLLRKTQIITYKGSKLSITTKALQFHEKKTKKSTACVTGTHIYLLRQAAATSQSTCTSVLETKHLFFSRRQPVLRICILLCAIQTIFTHKHIQLFDAAAAKLQCCTISNILEIFFFNQFRQLSFKVQGHGMETNDMKFQLFLVIMVKLHNISL